MICSQPAGAIQIESPPCHAQEDLDREKLYPNLLDPHRLKGFSVSDAAGGGHDGGGAACLRSRLWRRPLA